MTIRLSTGARNGLAAGLGFQGMFNKGFMHIYTGSQPATADAAHGSTLLGTVSVASGAITRETRASCTLTVTGAAASTILTVTVGGVNIIPDDATMLGLATTTLTADLVAAAINRNGMYEASTTGASNVITLKPRPGAGVVTSAAAATGTCTMTGSSFSGGVAAVNGLTLLSPATGIISKNALVWSMSGAAAGTAGWFRFMSSDTADSAAGLISAAPWYPRMDGSCGVGSGDAQLSSLAVTISSPHTVDTFSFTVPAA